MASKLQPSSRLKLSDGHSIPLLGLGVYEMSETETERAVTWALEAGYRHFDCAEWYYNERACGHAISRYLARSDCQIKRGDVFYTSKLQSNRGYESAKRSIHQSLAECGLDYIDLYLIHSPYGGKQRRLDSWRAIEEAKDAGLLKSIGVSNYGQRHIEELLATSPKHKPVINQCDLHPFMARLDLVGYCQDQGIALECWGPLVRAERMDHPKLQQLARKHRATSAQVLIRFSLQRGYVTIPKSVSKSRILENADVYGFELDPNDMDELLSLDEYLVTEFPAGRWGFGGTEQSWDPIGDSSV